MEGTQSPSSVRRLFEAALEQVGDGVAIVDAEGRHLYANPAMARMLGYSRDALLDMRVDDVVPPGTRLELFPRTVAGEAGIRRLRFRTADEQGLDAEVRSWPLDLDGERLVLAVVREDRASDRFALAMQQILERPEPAASENLLQYFTKTLAGVLGLDVVFVGVVEEGGQVRSVAGWTAGAPLPSFTYDLRGSPCEGVVGRKACLWPSSVQATFPEDPALVEQHIEAYVGVPLTSSTGEALGLVVGLHRAAIADPATACSLFEVFAGWIASELQRHVEAERRHALDERHRAYVELLSNIRQAVLRAGSIAQIAEPAVAGLVALADCDRVSLAVLDESPPGVLASHARVYASGPAAGQLGAGERVEVAVAFPSLAALERGEVVAISDADGDWAENRVLGDLRAAGLHCAVSLPLGVEGQVLGILSLGSVRREGIDEASLALAHEVGESLTPALIGARLRARLLREAAALRDSRDRYRRLFQSAPVGVFHYDANLVLTDANESFVNLLDSQRERLIGLDLRTLRDQRVLPALEAAARGVPGLYEGPYEATTGDAHVEVSLRTAPVRDAEGRVTSCIGIVEDVTERRRAQAARRASEERYRDLVERAGVGILVDDREGRIVYVNRRSCEILGREERALLGSTSLDLVHPEDHQRVEDILGARKRGEPWAPEHYGFRVETASGRTVHVAVDVTPRLEHGPAGGTLAYLRDVTEQRELEAHFLQAQKMESIGRLAGGVAHDFNNMLQVFKGHLGLLADQALPASAAARIDVLRRTADRAEHLTRQLLAFSRRQVLKSEPVVLDDLLASTFRMVRRIVGEDLALTLENRADNLSVRVDRGQIEQVILNLVINARDATPEGGRIAIRTDKLQADPAFAALHPWAHAGEVYAVLSVEDNGCGIPAHLREKIFEPFFTTKQAGQGTGLGLSTAQGIVSQHGGGMRVTSIAGEGTTVHVYLPQETGPVSGEAAPVVPNRVPRGAGERILLAEDDASVREVVTDILTDAGYVLEIAEDGVAAVARFEADPSAVDLALLDVVMPRLGGPGAAAALRALRPDLPILFASGYSEELVDERVRLDERTELIQKPYTGAELLRVVDRMLRAAATRRGAGGPAA